MWAIASPRVRAVVAGWSAFVGVNAALMYALPGEETIPYHLIWASFALLYGLVRVPARWTWSIFGFIVVITGIPLVRHARMGYIRWEECSEIVLMGVIAALLVWHVDRYRRAQDQLQALRERERTRAEQRELATRFGSHELRTRLTIARGFTEVVHDRSAEEPIREDARHALLELDKARVLADNLLTLVRVDSAWNDVPVDLDELVSGVVRRWAAGVPRAWTLRTDIGVVQLDAERVEAALDCLVENAIKFTSEGGRIAVTAEIVDRAVLLAVEDDGDGIPAEDVPRVTELFHVSASAGGRGGSGLGLPIVRAIVESRGGRLEVSSRVGEGTRIAIRLPGVASEAAAARNVEVAVVRAADEISSADAAVVARSA